MFAVNGLLLLCVLLAGWGLSLRGPSYSANPLLVAA